MKTPDIYILRTETAVRKIIEGVEAYANLLHPVCDLTFMCGEQDAVKKQALHEEWAIKNKETLESSFSAQREYWQQAFAMATLCGAILQIAAKAIECYSNNQHLSTSLKSIVGHSKTALPFCIGREVKGIPIGLIIFAGRNQHTHFNEANLAAVNTAVFTALAKSSNFSHSQDPAFDLKNPLIESFASNVTGLLGWRSYEKYVSDLRSLLIRKTD